MLTQLYDDAFYTWDFDELYHIKFYYDKDDYTDYVKNLAVYDTESSQAALIGKHAIAFDFWKYEVLLHYHEAFKNAPKVSCSYLWQCGIMDINRGIKIAFLGRTIDDFAKFLKKLCDETKRQTFYGLKCDDEDKRKAQTEYAYSKNRLTSIKIYVHNLAFDFQLLRNAFNEQFSKHYKGRGNVFARENRRTMKAITNIDGLRVTFADSYVLVNRSLAAWGADEGLTVQKIHEEQDWYLKIRTPVSDLSEETVAYAVTDCITMLEGLQKFEDRYEQARFIPLTQASTVRLKCFDALKPNEEWRLRTLHISQAYSYKFFKTLCKLYTGGYTHANATYVNKAIKSCIYGLIICHDFNSSYPHCLTSATYPVEEFVECDVTEFETLKNLYRGKALWTAKIRWFGKFRIKNVVAKLENSFLSYSKLCEQPKTRPSVDNGRIRKCDEIVVLLSDTDWDIFRNAYDFDEDIEVLELYKSKADYLPKELVELILSFYNDKTKLKGVEGAESRYRIAKVDVNAMYGVMVTKIITKIVDFIKGKWREDERKKGETVEEFKARKEKELETEYYKTISEMKLDKMIAPYQCGIWCCKMAMWNLWHFFIGDDEHEGMDERIIYCDTDSIKGLLNENDLKFIEDYNKWVEELQNKAAEALGIDPELYCPKTVKGETKRLGIFDREHDCVTFGTKGAKRYYCEYYTKKKLKNGQVIQYLDRETTIAGLPKSAGKKKIHSVEEFLNENHTKFNERESEKLTCYYNDNQPEGVIWIDEHGKKWVNNEKYGVAIIPTGFDLSIKGDFVKLLEAIETGEGNDVFFNDIPLGLIK